jgi:hypothetical protein
MFALQTTCNALRLIMAVIMFDHLKGIGIVRAGRSTLNYMGTEQVRAAALLADAIGRENPLGLA